MVIIETKDENPAIKDDSLISKKIEENLHEAIEAMNKGDVRNFESFMNDIKKKYPDHE